MKDLNSRIKQLTNLILTSQTVDENRGDESRPASPSKIDFDMTPYQVRRSSHPPSFSFLPGSSSEADTHARTPQLQQELLSARREIESQATQILSLEVALLARPELPPDAPESEKDRLLGEQARNIRELEMVVKGYEDNLGAPLRAVREDVEREWSERLAAEEAKRKEAEEWATELARALEKEKKVRSVIRVHFQKPKADDHLDTAAAGRRTTRPRGLCDQVRLANRRTLRLVLRAIRSEQRHAARTRIEAIVVVPRRAPAADRRIAAAHGPPRRAARRAEPARGEVGRRPGRREL